MNLAVLFLLAQESAPVGSAAAGQSFSSGLLHLLWAFANSPLGVVVVSAGLLHLLAWIFTKQPKAAKLFDEHKGIFFDAVRFAEAQVPEGAPDSGATKMKHALQFIEKLEHPVLDSAREGDLKRAIEMAHAAETASTLAQNVVDAKVHAAINGTPETQIVVNPTPKGAQA